MRRFHPYPGYFIVIMFAFTACTKTPRVDGHGDGEMTLPVNIVVLDAKSNEPIVGAQITAYSERETTILEIIEINKQKNRLSHNTAPKGRTVVTLENGRAKIECVFDAAFLWSYESGHRRDVGTNVFPSGRFIVSRAGYLTVDQPARNLFKDGPYTPKSFETPMVIRLTNLTPAPSVTK